MSYSIVCERNISDLGFNRENLLHPHLVAAEQVEIARELVKNESLKVGHRLRAAGNVGLAGVSLLIVYVHALFL